MVSQFCQGAKQPESDCSETGLRSYHAGVASAGHKSTLSSWKQKLRGIDAHDRAFDRGLRPSSAEGLTSRARRGLWHLGADLSRPGGMAGP